MIRVFQYEPHHEPHSHTLLHFHNYATLWIGAQQIEMNANSKLNTSIKYFLRGWRSHFNMCDSHGEMCNIVRNSYGIAIGIAVKLSICVQLSEKKETIITAKCQANTHNSYGNYWDTRVPSLNAIGNAHFVRVKTRPMYLLHQIEKSIP